MADNTSSIFQSPQFWGQMGSSVMSGATGLIGQALQYKYNKRLMKRQNQYNIDMWKMQADYNSPQSQMQRFQEAGLNPNLIYGQGSNGNMSSAPEQGVPEAPNFTPGLQKLAEAFNIAGLRKAVADAKHAEADARSAKTDADRNHDMYEADKAVGQQYDYDYKTGQFVPVDTSGNVLTVYKYPGQRFYKLKRVNDAFRYNALIPDRQAYYKTYNKLYAPEIEMRNYEAKHKAAGYWIDKTTRVLNSVGGLVPKFSGFRRPPITYRNSYNYFNY